MCERSTPRWYCLPLAGTLLAWGLALAGLVGAQSGVAAGEGGPYLSDDRLLALVRPEVAERVKLTAKQREAIDRMVGQLHRRLKDLVKDYPKGAQDTEGEEGRRQSLKEADEVPRWRED